MAIALENSVPESEWPSPRLRWVLLGTFLALLALIFISGAAAIRTLREMHRQEQDARLIMAERGQQLSGLFVSVEVYNQTIGRFVGYPGTRPNPLVRQELDQESADLTSRLNSYPSLRQSQEEEFLRKLDDLCNRHRELYQAALSGSLTRDLVADQVLAMRSQILDWSASSVPGTIIACRQATL